MMQDVRYLKFGNLYEQSVEEVIESIPSSKFKSIPAPNLKDCDGYMHLNFCIECPARFIQAIEYH
ncbi:MAG: hypothetical protein HZA84_01220 [Thaumarchaeota archaeon]|nr:hypothetical protein [Nitrososphaerota archaeon]